MATLIYRIGNIHCIGCVNRITNALKSEGALSVDIDFSTHIAKVTTKEHHPDERIYLKVIKDTGYQAEYLTVIGEEDSR